MNNNFVNVAIFCPDISIKGNKVRHASQTTGLFKRHIDCSHDSSPVLVSQFNPLSIREFIHIEVSILPEQSIVNIKIVLIINNLQNTHPPHCKPLIINNL